MKSPIACQHHRNSRPAWNQVRYFAQGLQQTAPASLLLLAIALLSSSSQAQTVRFKSSQTTVSVPLNFSGSPSLTNLVSVSGLNSNVTLSVSGAPAGLTPTLSASSIAANTTITITLNCTNVAGGLYPLSLNGTDGATNTWPFLLDVAAIWTGDTNLTTSWSSSGSWVGGNIPGAVSEVLFGQVGAQTNVLVNGLFFSNSVVDQNFEVASLRFVQTNSAAKFHTIFINPSVVLNITGTNGLTLLHDYVDELQGLSAGQTVTFAGLHGTMVVSNESANIGVLLGNQSAPTLSLTDLGNFVTDVNRIGLADFQLFPNYRNYNDLNNYGGRPSKFDATVNLARTNVIKAVFADPYNYTNEFNRGYSLSFCDSELSGTGGSPANNLVLGISNAFFLDSVCIVRANHQGFLKFPTAFATNNPIAIFRSPTGGRMSVFTISDDAGTNNASSNVKCTVDFGSANGTVDILADRFYMARDRSLITSNQTPNIQSDMFVGKGIVDVNTAILGYQEHSSKTNWTAIGGAAGYLNYCQGRLSITNGATFRVNQTLTLGFTADTNPPAVAQQFNTFGQVTVNNGSTLSANTIVTDGGLNLSGANRISMTGGNVIVSNTIAGASKPLDQLNFNGGSSLMVHLDGNVPGPYIYTTNLNTVGQSNVLVVARVLNTTFPVQFPVISYSAGGAALGARMGAGFPSYYFASIVDNGPGSTVDVYISTNAPKNLLWRGTTTNWNTTSKNWLDLNTGLMTNYVDPDAVTFDDTPGYPTNIALVTPSLKPSSITVTNTTIQKYTFISTSGNIETTASLTKTGTGTLQIDGNTAVIAAVNQGTLTGSGSLGGATVASNAVMFYAGTINGSVACAGTVTISNTCSVLGPLALQPGAVVTNRGNVNGTVTIQTASLLVNSNLLQNIGSPTVPTNSTLINAGGSIYGLTLDVAGTFEDLGAPGVIYMNADVNNRGLTIDSGGTFIPGGDGIGTTTVSDSGSAATYPGRVLFAQGSTNIIKVNPASPAYTIVQSEVMGFGPNGTAKQINGGTIVISNTTATAFTAGQSFRIFRNSFNGGNVLNAGLNTTNSYPIMVPAAPGPGLAWDLSALIVPNISGNNGLIGISTVNTTPTNLTATFTLTGSNIVTELSWPSDYLGWKLQQQQNSIGVGISTNWTTVFDSLFNTDVFITNNLNVDTAFYRMVYP